MVFLRSERGNIDVAIMYNRELQSQEIDEVKKLFAKK